MGIENTGNVRRTPQRQVEAAAPAAAKTKAAPKRKAAVAEQPMAPSTGKVPGRARTASAGQTLRSQGKATESVTDLKGRLRSDIKDAKSLDGYLAERQGVYEAARNAANEGFAQMETNLKESEALRQEVTAGLANVLQYVPAELKAELGLNEGKEVKKSSWLGGLFSKFQKKQEESQPIGEMSISKAMFEQIKLIERITLDLQSKHEILEADQSRQAAARTQFQDLLEKAVNDLNDVMVVHLDVNTQIDDIKEAIAKATPETPTEDLASWERELADLSGREQELTRLALFLQHATESYRAFEKNAEQLASMTTTVLSNTETQLLTAFQNIEMQSSMAQVVGKIADVLRASDLLTFATEDMQKTLEKVTAYIGKRVSTHQVDLKASHQRIMASQERIFQTLAEANSVSDAQLREASDKLIADTLAGKFETFQRSRLPTGVTPSANPLRQRGMDIQARLRASMDKKQATLGVGDRFRNNN